ncbi:heme-binding domain-containing protein [Mangrovibacterium lignilyticum]|uniref:heme-binding domain-containing protein n=1 Tax=Mangrovibacterium lignilyticum TaxID=2668052 RepID=UPI0013CF6FAB|nr:heme-binding domain-containing protein [Mangrovibacterium lignilyticum]
MIKKNTRIYLIIVLVALVGIQFFQPKRNTAAITSDHLFQQTHVPGNVQQVLNHACMDCHSDQTKYEWYHKISPVSWYINHHISEGKHELNFSNWRSISPLDKISLLEDVKKEVGSGKMPLKAYTLIHREARLTVAQRDSLFSWVEKYQEELMQEALN